MLGHVVPIVAEIPHVAVAILGGRHHCHNHHWHPQRPGPCMIISRAPTLLGLMVTGKKNVSPEVSKAN